MDLFCIDIKYILLIHVSGSAYLCSRKSLCSRLVRAIIYNTSKRKVLTNRGHCDEYKYVVLIVLVSLGSRLDIILVLRRWSYRWY